MRKYDAKVIEKHARLADAYFDTCDAENGDEIKKPYTLAGLLCALGLSRDQFFSLRVSRAGAKFVTYALLKIEAFIQENALSGRLSAKAACDYLKEENLDGEERCCEPERLLVTLSPQSDSLAE